MRTRTKVFLLGLLLLVAFGLGMCVRATPAPTVVVAPLHGLAVNGAESTARLMAFLAVVNPLSSLICLCPVMLLAMAAVVVWYWRRTP